MKNVILIFFILISCAISKQGFAQDKEYGIAIRLPKEYFTAAQKMNRAISAQEASPNSRNVFHITLFQGRFDQNKIDELQKTLRAQHFEKFRITFGLEIKTAQNLYINWIPKENNELKKMHHRVVEIANSYRLGILSRYIDSYGDLTKEQRQQVVKYGMPGLFDDYEPHLTLFYFDKKNSEIEKIANKISVPENGHEINCCDATTLLIAEIGYRGNIEKVLYEIELQ